MFHEYLRCNELISQLLIIVSLVAITHIAFYAVFNHVMIFISRMRIQLQNARRTKSVVRPEDAFTSRSSVTMPTTVETIRTNRIVVSSYTFYMLYVESDMEQSHKLWFGHMGSFKQLPIRKTWFKTRFVWIEKLGGSSNVTRPVCIHLFMYIFDS